MPRMRVLAASVACLLLTLGTGSAVAQTSDELFDVSTLQEIRLFMSSRDLATLKEKYEENDHYPADLQWRNLRVRNVAVRSRGTGSRTNVKLGLELDFTRYAADQRFLGMASLVLDNLVQDPAMVREQVAMAFFTRMGLPAPRESFAKLYINDVYYGVYGVLETITTEFLQRTVGGTDPYVFEYHYLGPFFGEYLGDALDPYKALFEPRSHKRESDTVLYAPLRDLFREANGPDDAVWRDRVEAYIDLAQLVRYVAVEMFLAEADGFLNLDGMSNFYLYRPRETTQHRLIPWDKDRVFFLLEFSVIEQVDTNVLLRRALAYPDLRALYLSTVDDCARSAGATDPSAPDVLWMDEEIARASAVVADAAAVDSLKPFTNDEMAAAVSEIRDFARRRPGIVLQELAKIRAAATR